MLETPFSIHGKGIIQISGVKLNQAREEMNSVMGIRNNSSNSDRTSSGGGLLSIPRRTLQEVLSPSYDQISLLAKRGRVGLFLPLNSSIKKSNDFIPPKKKKFSISAVAAAEVKHSIHSNRDVVLEHHSFVRRISDDDNDDGYDYVENSANQTENNGQAAGSNKHQQRNAGNRTTTLKSLRVQECMLFRSNMNSDDISGSINSCREITPQNSKSYQFTTTRSNNSTVLVGWSSLRQRLLTELRPLPLPKVMTKDWVSNHYRWIVWKCACMARQFPKQCGSLGHCEDDGLSWFTPQRVLKQLKQRWKREHDNGERSCLKKIYESDASPQRYMILCVSRVIRNDTTSDVVWGLELTDGWYSIGCRVDKGLTNILSAGWDNNNKNSGIGSGVVGYGGGGNGNGGGGGGGGGGNAKGKQGGEGLWVKKAKGPKKGV